MKTTTRIDRLRARVRAHRGAFRALSQASGISYSWLSKFANGHYRNPGVYTLDALEAALDAADAPARAA